MNKVIVIILISTACISLILPFQEFESMWNGFVFDPAGNILEEGVNTNHIILGYELVFPIVPVILLILGSIFSGIVKNDYGKTVGLVFGCLNLLITIYLFFLVANPVEARPYTITRPPVPIIGIGSYILLFTSIAALVYAVLRFSHK